MTKENVGEEEEEEEQDEAGRRVPLLLLLLLPLEIYSRRILSRISRLLHIQPV